MALAVPPPGKRQPVLHQIANEGDDLVQSMIDDFWIDLTTYLTKQAAFDAYCDEREAA
jgi:hypothetical protein